MIIIEDIHSLGDAIIVQATKDYKTALTSKDKDTIMERERFFHSELFDVLTTIDGDYLIERLRKEVRRK